MKIIQHGDLSRLSLVKRFRCALCGCVFEASEFEYLPTPSAWKNTYNMPGTDFMAKCPECGSFVSEENR